VRNTLTKVIIVRYTYDSKEIKQTYSIFICIKKRKQINLKVLFSHFIFFLYLLRVLQRIIIALIHICNYHIVIYVVDEMNYHVYLIV
jgi:hypothetical protein